MHSFKKSAVVLQAKRKEIVICAKEITRNSVKTLVH